MKRKQKKIMEQATLFKEPKLRRKNGRYCTKEQYLHEAVFDENKSLKLKCEKYYRMYIAVEKENERLNRELIVLKSKIEALL